MRTELKQKRQSEEVPQVKGRPNAAFGWFGGKHRLRQTIASKIPCAPRARIYLEPFGGAASVLMAKEPSPIEVYNYLDSGLANFFRVLIEPECLKELQRRLSLTLYSREEWRRCDKGWRTEKDPIEKARMFFVAFSQSFNGNPLYNSWSCSGPNYGGNVARTFRNSTGNLEAVAARFRYVQVECQPALTVMKRYDRPDCFIYADPPYLPSTRGKTGRYNYEMTEQDHTELLEFLVEAKSMVILSGYPSPLYDEKLLTAGWQKECHTAIASSAFQRLEDGTAIRNSSLARRTECLWLNPQLIEALAAQAQEREREQLTAAARLGYELAGGPTQLNFDWSVVAATTKEKRR